jgi:prophage regulatory protein
MTPTMTTCEPASGAGSDSLRACTLLRLPEVLRARGRSRSTHYSDIHRGLFTRAVSLGAHCVAWPESEVIALNRARISGMPDQEICALVLRLEATRKRDGALEQGQET